MTRYVLRDGKLVEKRYAAPRAGLIVIGDSMAAVASPVDGRMFDSKAALRAHYRDSGVYEVGNDIARETYPTETHDPRSGRRLDELR